jgi:leucyl/phenylalanyl-tRNA--protein transferase
VLEPDLLLTAYRQGIFPMAIDSGKKVGTGRRRDIAWFAPDPRAVIPLDDRFHVPHGLRRTLKQERFEITFDTSFDAVIRACAKRKEGTWISKEIIESYCELHRLGHAHSVETLLKGKLVGGLYGVHIGGAFFGESMFHRATDASKVALVALVGLLRARKFVLLDTQWLTPHLKQFGTYEIPRHEYLWRLEHALKLNCKF